MQTELAISITPVLMRRLLNRQDESLFWFHWIHYESECLHAYYVCIEIITCAPVKYIGALCNHCESRLITISLFFQCVLACHHVIFSVSKTLVDSLPYPAVHRCKTSIDFRTDLLVVKKQIKTIQGKKNMIIYTWVLFYIVFVILKFLIR